MRVPHWFPIWSSFGASPRRAILSLFSLANFVHQAPFFSPNSNTTGGLNVTDYIIPFCPARQLNSFPVSRFYVPH